MLIKLLGAIAFIVLIVGAIGYWSGWVSFSSNGDTKSIEVNSKEMKSDTQKAIDQGKGLIEKTGDFLKGKKESKKDQESSSPSLQN